MNDREREGYEGEKHKQGAPPMWRWPSHDSDQVENLMEGKLRMLEVIGDPR